MVAVATEKGQIMYECVEFRGSKGFNLEVCLLKREVLSDGALR